MVTQSASGLTNIYLRPHQDHRTQYTTPADSQECSRPFAVRDSHLLQKDSNHTGAQEEHHELPQLLLPDAAKYQSQMQRTYCHGYHSWRRPVTALEKEGVDLILRLVSSYPFKGPSVDERAQLV
ncbi:uncharacterized protein LOC132405321 isoform X3 [Hypanus sabinus]|uniref:uncharacterized protein LOC132405321 isoform X3 n=1 Tax=Hypanus sabinus TaxID=79690 RepID=UPI0028C4313A|nr:uncharacterized protein LOC132405321 isoform X3 [Hypanus sabinus]